MIEFYKVNEKEKKKGWKKELTVREKLKLQVTKNTD